jgi:type I restriction enzyme S subunit
MNKIYLSTTEKYLTEEGRRSKSLRLIPRGSLLFTSRATIGYLAVNKVEVTINQGIIALIPRIKDLDVTYYYYYLTSVRKKLEELAGGSTYKEISMNTFRKLMIPHPPLEEQRKIAGILSIVDRAIEVVDAGVARLEGLKKALMRELLTGRIRVREENGKLVFYRETEFQDTEIGKIPKEWRIVRLIEVAEVRGSKKLPKNVESVVFIPMEAVPDNSLYVNYVIRNADEVKSYVYCEPGDLLVAKITPSFENGKQGIVPYDLPGKFALATTEVYPIKCNNIDKLFLFYLLKYPPIRSKLASLMRGTTGRRRVSREALENTLLPYPPIHEQRRIAEILFTVDRAIELYREERVRLDRLKRGLMDLLLTGKIRVVED